MPVLDHRTDGVGEVPGRSEDGGAVGTAQRPLPDHDHRFLRGLQDIGKITLVVQQRGQSCQAVAEVAGGVG